MAKPTVRVPVWSSGGTNTDPGGSKEAAGWLVSERPPAYWLNWVLNAMGQHLDYLDGLAIPLAAGKIVTGGTPSLLYSTGGMGMTPVLTFTSNDALLTFSSSLVDSISNSAVIVSQADDSPGGDVNIGAEMTSATVCRIGCVDDAGTARNLASYAMYISYSIYGTQA